MKTTNLARFFWGAGGEIKRRKDPGCAPILVPKRNIDSRTLEGMLIPTHTDCQGRISYSFTRKRIKVLTSPDFSIAFAPKSPTTAPPGSEVTYTLNITRVGNLNGTINLSGKIVGMNPVFARPAGVNPASVSLGCSTSPARSVTLQPAKLNCTNTATAQLILEFTVLPADPYYSPTQNVEVDGTYSNGNTTISHSAKLTLTVPPPSPTQPPPPGIQAVADLLTGSGQLALPSQCATDPRFNCDANNQPISTMLQLTRNNISFGQFGASLPNTYAFTANLELKTQSNVPVSFAGQSCSIAIDTGGGAPTIVNGTLTIGATSTANTYQISLTPLGVVGAQPITMSTVSGTYAASVCTVSSTLSVGNGTISWGTVTMGYIQQALAERVSNPVCISVSGSGTASAVKCP
jgi:hypothetical protein